MKQCCLLNNKQLQRSHAKSIFSIANPSRLSTLRSEMTERPRICFSKSPRTLATASNHVAKQAADLLLRGLLAFITFIAFIAFMPAFIKKSRLSLHSWKWPKCRPYTTHIRHDLLFTMPTTTKCWHISQKLTAKCWHMTQKLTASSGPKAMPNRHLQLQIRAACPDS